MTDFDEQDALAYAPFAGDKRYMRVMSDKIVTAAKCHPHCQICHGPIVKGERHRARVEINLEDWSRETWRFCGDCCRAMCGPGDNVIVEREPLGEQRRTGDAK